MEHKQKGRKAGVKNVPENETKEAKFIRLGKARVNKVLKGIKQIKNLSAPNYTSTPEQVEKIFTAIQNAVDDAKNSFANKTPEKTNFEL